MDYEEEYRILENEFGFHPQYRPKGFLQGLISGWCPVYNRSTPVSSLVEAKALIKKWKNTLEKTLEEDAKREKVKRFIKYHKYEE